MRTQTGGAGTAAEEAAMGLGIDVSHYSEKRDWRCLVKLGIDFAFIRATEGATVKDELFARHRTSLRGAGIPCGAYHFAHPGSAAAAKPAARATPPRADEDWPGRVFVYPSEPLVAGDDVRRWQACMAEHGWAIAEDGKYGPRSRQACVSLQRHAGLGPDGIVGPMTGRATLGPHGNSPLAPPQPRGGRATS